MIKISEFQNLVGRALADVFRGDSENERLITVYDHTEEIFDSEEEGIAVWCDVEYQALPWFDGKINFIISCSEGDVSAALFLGEECIDADAASRAADGFCCAFPWHVEEVSDSAMICSDFEADSAEEMEEKLKETLSALLDADFADAIKAVARYFK